MKFRRKQILENAPLKQNSAADPTSEEFSPDGISRRDALKMMGASALAVSGLAGCERKPRRPIVSQTMMPEYMKPGEPLFYASTWTAGPFPYGLLVKTVDGRPIKIDGNPAHPINREASTAYMQAALISLYDPDRLFAPIQRGTAPVQEGKLVSWPYADRQVITALQRAKRVALITRSTLGFSERELVRQFQGYGPQVWHFVHERVNDSARRNTWRSLFGEEGELVPQFSQAQVVLSIGSDFLGTDGAVLESAREFAQTRNPDAGQHVMSRLYVAEAAFTTTGANADHRIRLKPSLMLEFCQALLADLSGAGSQNAQSASAFASKYHLDVPTAEALVRDLAAQKGRALVVAGPELPAQVHAAVSLINQSLDAYGKTLHWSSPAATLPISDVAEVESVLGQGVDVLIALGTNPVFDWPGQDFRGFIQKAGLSVAHGLLPDDTVTACTIGLPSAHNLESWNDAAPRPGLQSLCQPMIEPLGNARQEAESLLTWTRALSPGASWTGIADWHDFVRTRWQRQIYSTSGSPASFDEYWEGALRAGVITQSVKPSSAKFNAVEAENILRRNSPQAAQGLELILRPHPGIWDGRFANADWLQELPDPITKVVWDNPAQISPATAKTMEVQTGDTLEIRAGKGRVTLPVFIQPGLADGVIVTTLGSGALHEGHLRQEKSFPTSRLISQKDGITPHLAYGVQAQKTGENRKIVQTQLQPTTVNRPILLQGTLAQFREDPNFIRRLRHLPETADIHRPYRYLKHRWAMVIDLNACQACGGCVVACQAENNIPAIGKRECDRGRAMHWLRLDRYYFGKEEDPAIGHQIILCQHCENAPCENVCPVAATTHSPEGINEMTYNRCVGTRYCSNNCPYKVRRFNFFNFTERFAAKSRLNLMYNPQVTVRSVGIMEKCTYCIQRINSAKYHASISGEKIPDGSVKTACQQACPAGAITFGDINDPNSAVTKLFESKRMYHLLAELNTDTRTVYLAKVTNPAPGTAAEERIFTAQSAMTEHHEESH